MAAAYVTESTNVDGIRSSLLCCAANLQLGVLGEMSARQALLQIYRSELKPWSSVSTSWVNTRSAKGRNRPHVLKKGRDSGTNEVKDDEIQNVASNRDHPSVEAIGGCGEDPGSKVEFACIEVEGDEPKVAGSETKVSNCSDASVKGAGVTEPTTFGEKNLSLLISLGANEEQRTLLLK